MPIKTTITPYSTRDSRGRVRESIYGTVSQSLEITDETTDEEIMEMRRIIARNSFEGKLNGAEEFAKGLLGTQDRQGSFEKGSQAWYGQQLLTILERLRDWLGRSTDSATPHAAMAAMNLGWTWAIASYSARHEFDTLRGKNIASAASAGGHVAAQERRSELEARNLRLQSRADEIWARNPQLSVAAVSKLLAREPGVDVGFETIRRVISKKTR